MWKGLKDWTLLANKWMSLKFEEISVEEIKQVSQKYTKVINKCSKKLPINPVLDKFKVLLKTFKDAMPVVIALSNKVVQEDEQYWSEIQRIVNKKFVIDGSFTLKSLIDMNFHDFQNELIEISNQARQQQVLKSQIE